MAPRPPTTFSIFEGGTPLQPLRFIASAGRPGKSVEIWETRNILFPYSPRELVAMVAAFSKRKKRWVGTMDLRIRLRTDEDFTCEKDLDALAAKVPDLDSSRVVQVSGASLLDEFHGAGIGTALYLASVALAWRDGLALAADACFKGATSDDARRVWRSREFNKHVLVSGMMGVYRS